MMLNDQEKTLRKYLLGELSEEENEGVELWLMSEEEAYVLLDAAEDDLIDASIAGILNPHELERFNNQFLNAAQRKRKLWFGQAFSRFVGEKQPSIASAKVSAPTLSFWDFLRYRPSLAYAATALIVLFVGGGFWAGFRFQDMQRRLDTAGQLAAQHEASGERLRSDLRSLESALANVKASPAPEAFLAAALMPGLSRSSTDIPKVALAPKVQFVEFSLALLNDDYDSYSAVLVDDAGQELWARDSLNPRATGENKAIVLLVPRERLATGVYSFRLSGRSASNPPQAISVYTFQSSR